MLQYQEFPENHNSAAMATPDMTVLEWQRARLKQQQQQHPSYCAEIPTTLDLQPNPFSILPAGTAAAFHACSAFGDEEGSVAHDLWSNMSPDLMIHYPFLGSSFISGGEGRASCEGGDGALRTFSCPPVVGETKTKATPLAPASPFNRGVAAVAAAAQYSTDGGRGSTRKRKAAHRAITQETDEDDREKRRKGVGCYTDALIEPKLETPPISSTTTTTTADGEDHNPGSSKQALSETSKEKHSKGSEPPPKADYIHVRARRGQATDSHSLAERVRREKISKRMKLLQDLVPGCNRVTGKAGVLDEIINYVHSLQRQVEFLSMKLAAVSPTIGSNMDAFFSKEIMQMIPHFGGALPSLGGMLPRSELLGASSFLIHANTTQTQQAGTAATAVGCSGLEVAASSSCSDEQAALLRLTAARAPALVSECCSVMDSQKVQDLAPTSPWEADLHALYSVNELQQGLGRGALPSAAGAAPAAAPIFQ